MQSSLSMLSVLSGTGSEKSTVQSGGLGADNGGIVSGFATLLAQLGANAGSTNSDGTSASQTQLILPGTPDQQKLALKDLSEDLDALAAWFGTAMQAQQPAQMAAPLEPDAIPEAGSIPAEKLAILSEKLMTMLVDFDEAYGANTREVLLKNASMMPEISLPANPAKAGQAFLAMTRLALGLEPGTTPAAQVATPDSVKVSSSDASGTAATIKQSSELQQALSQVSSQTSGELRQSYSFQEILSLRPAEPLSGQSISASAPSATSQPAPQPQISGFAANLVGQIKGTQISEGTTRVELSPRGLGGIEIDLTRDDEGSLKVTVRAENPTVVAALRDNRDALMLALRDTGVTLENNALGFEDFGQDQRQPARQQEQTNHVIIGTEEDVPDTPLAAAPAIEGRVDILT